MAVVKIIGLHSEFPVWFHLLKISGRECLEFLSQTDWFCSSPYSLFMHTTFCYPWLWSVWPYYFLRIRFDAVLPCLDLTLWMSSTGIVGAEPSFFSFRHHSLPFFQLQVLLQDVVTACAFLRVMRRGHVRFITFANFGDIPHLGDFSLVFPLICTLRCSIFFVVGSFDVEFSLFT